MPLYEYECLTCGELTTELRPIAERDAQRYCKHVTPKGRVVYMRTVRVVSRLGAVVVQGGTK
jgi:putative FmdB family regulatory protein